MDCHRPTINDRCKCNRLWSIRSDYEGKLTDILLQIIYRQVGTGAHKPSFVTRQQVSQTPSDHTPEGPDLPIKFEKVF